MNDSYKAFLAALIAGHAHFLCDYLAATEALSKWHAWFLAIVMLHKTCPLNVANCLAKLGATGVLKSFK